MNENIKKIAELSNCEWIKKRWKPRAGDWVIRHYKDELFGESKELQVLIRCLDYGEGYWQITNKDGESRLATTDDIIKKQFSWLPVGFNSETGNWHIDDLLMEILKCDISHLKSEYVDRCLYVIDAPDFDEYNDIVLKLVWLRKLIVKR